MNRKFPIDRVMLDTMTTLFVLFAAFFALEAIQQKAEKSQSSGDLTRPEGHITVEAEWPQDADVDVDLWVKGPQDEKPVGYSRTNDHQSSYDRDDRGVTNDLSHFNYEVATMRGLLPGLYIVNVHWFGNYGKLPQVIVKIRAGLSNMGHGSYNIAMRELTLKVKGEEQTAFTFEIDSEKALVEGSVLNNYIPLRSGDKSE